jgi:hypothetical protein
MMEPPPIGQRLIALRVAGEGGRSIRMRTSTARRMLPLFFVFTAAIVGCGDPTVTTAATDRLLANQPAK